MVLLFKCSTIGAVAAAATSNGAVYDFAYDANDVARGFEGYRSSHLESGYVVGLWSQCSEYSSNVSNLFLYIKIVYLFDWFLWFLLKHKEYARLVAMVDFWRL